MRKDKGDAEDILEVISGVRRELYRSFNVKRIGIFGSCARGEAHRTSDVDVIVEMDEPTFDHYMDLKFRLEELLGRPVDLVLNDTLKSRLRPVIAREVVYA